MKDYLNDALSATFASRQLQTEACGSEDDLKHKVQDQIYHHWNQVEEERSGWFHRHFMPPSSVLARLPKYDCDALIAHFHAKELRNLADALHEGDRYKAGLVRKRLKRVEEMAKAFAEALAI